MAELVRRTIVGRPGMTPSVGVVVALRDAAHFVSGALESVCAQLTGADRIVVVVGRSSDGSADAARRFVSRRVHIDVIEQRSDGLASARNEGLSMLDHDVVTFCDADDRWRPGALDVRRAALDRVPGPHAVIGSVQTVALDGVDVPALRRADLGSVAPGYTPGALLARRSVFDAVGPFDPQLAIGCDTDWFLRLKRSGCRLAVVDDVVLDKGVRPNSLSVDIDRYRSELIEVARRHARHRRRGSDGNWAGRG
jgi:glycosyltransferase involved in cell wall biosynthesis